MTVAQQPQTIRIRGTIENVDGPNLTIKARDGNTMQVKLGDNARITAWSRQRSPTSSQDRLAG